MQPTHAYNPNSLERKDKSTALKDGPQSRHSDPILKTSQVW
jgi:hypothetical protein